MKTREMLQQFRTVAVRSPRVFSVLLALLGGVGLLGLRLNETIDRKMQETEMATYDFRMQSRAQRSLSGDLMMVGMTDFDLDHFQRSIVSRLHHYRMLKVLARLGAKAAIFDVVFIDEVNEPLALALTEDYYGDGDLAFQMQMLDTYLAHFFYIGQQYPGSEELERRKRAVPEGWLSPYNTEMGGVFPPGISPNEIRLPNLTLLAEAKGIGHINAIPDSDGVVRRIPLVLRFRDTETMGDMLSPTLALRAVLDRLGVAMSDVRVRFGDALEFTTPNGQRYSVPIDESGQMLINFREGRSFSERQGFSSGTIIDMWRLLYSNDPVPNSSYEGGDFIIEGNRVVANRFSGATVFIGDVAVGSTDIRSTSMDPALPMMTIHANVMDQILNQDHVAEAPGWMEPVLSILFALVVGLYFGRIGYLLSFMLVSGIAAVYAAVTWFAFANWSLWLPLLMPNLALLVSGMFILLFHLLIEDRRRTVIRGVFEAYTSPEVVETILLNIDDPALWGAKRCVTTLFVDIRGFTTLTEETAPEQTVEILNEFYTVVVNALRDHGGIPNKFIGDEIMALFNAPREIPQHELAACKAAIDIQRGVAKLNREILGPRLNKEIEVGIGVNTAEVIVGIVGREKIEYTALGDGVNVAARLQGQCRPGQVLIGPETYECLARDGQDFIAQAIPKIRHIPEIVLKGLKRRISVYELCYERREKKRG